MKKVFKMITAGALLFSLPIVSTHLQPYHANSIVYAEASMDSTTNIPQDSDDISIENMNVSNDQTIEGSNDQMVDDLEQAEQAEQVEQPEEPLPTSETAEPVIKKGEQIIVLQRNSTSIIYNGVTSELRKPIMEKNGVTYIPLKTIAELYGFKVSYDAKTKESIAQNQATTLKFSLNSKIIKVNDTSYEASGAVFSEDGNLMVPLRAWANVTNTALTLTDQTITLKWLSAPIAAFKVTNSKIFAKDTTVIYEDLATSPNGYAIVDERWTGRQDTFDAAGEYTITREVMDENGVWSEPFSVTITVLKQNEPPVAMFVTDKSTYKIGEPITYRNLSKDDYKIVRTNWVNNQPAFFEPGLKTISIEIEDEFGLISTYHHAVTITSEVMYSQEEFFLNFMKPGDKMPVDIAYALQADPISYKIESQDVTLVRLNSPERITGPAIDYTDTVDGKVRFSIHKQNASKQSLQMHMIATNNNSFPVYITNDNFSIGGPTTYVTSSGKAAVTRYLNSKIVKPYNKVIELLPGQSIEVMPSAGLVEIKPDQTVSMVSEYTTSAPVKFTALVTELGANATEQLTKLNQSAHDGKHTRGTFVGGDRELVFNHTFGSGGAFERIVLGDRVYDQYVQGVDSATGNLVTSAGNGDVLYNFTLDIAADTAVLINARGGHYAGAFIVNGEVVEVTNNSMLLGQNEAALLYRTGSQKESVEFTFITAPGSNMPINLLFVDVPKVNH